MAVAAPGRLGRVRAEIRIPRTTPKIIECVAAAMIVLAVLAFVMNYTAVTQTAMPCCASGIQPSRPSSSRRS